MPSWSPLSFGAFPARFLYHEGFLYSAGQYVWASDRPQSPAHPGHRIEENEERNSWELGQGLEPLIQVPPQVSDKMGSLQVLHYWEQPGDPQLLRETASKSPVLKEKASGYLTVLDLVLPDV